MEVLIAVIACGPQGVPLDRTLSSEHYLYRYASSDHVDVDRQEAYHAWLIGPLPIAPAGPVEYRKYKDRAHMEAVTGRATNGFADTTRLLIHTIWPWDNHEVVHTLVIRAWGLEALFRTSSFGAPAADTEAKFQAAYGTSLSAAWREWRDWLATTG